MKVLQLKDCISFSGVLPFLTLFSTPCLTAEGMVEKMPVIVLPVCVTSESKCSWKGENEDCRTVKGVYVTAEFVDWKSNNCPSTHHKNCYESPKPPVWFEKLVWHKIPTKRRLLHSFISASRSKLLLSQFLLLICCLRLLGVAGRKKNCIHRARPALFFSSLCCLLGSNFHNPESRSNALIE